MAIQSTAHNQFFRRTTGGFPTSLSGFSGLVWANLAADLNITTTIWGTDDGTNYVYLYNVNGDGTTIALETFGVAPASGPSMTLGTWYCFAWSFIQTSGGVQTLALHYRTASQSVWTTVGTGTTGGTLWTPNRETVGASEFNPTSTSFRGSLAGLKTWTAVLTPDELLNESFQYLPIRTQDFSTWYPFVGPAVSGVDYSGNGRALTATGTYTTADGPPIPWCATRNRRIYIPGAVIPSGTPNYLTLLGCGA